MTKMSYKERHMKVYANQKKRMLERDFYITLTTEELKHFDELKSEAEVDNYVRDLLRKYL